MNYTLMPSLEHIASVSIAIALWNKDDIKALRARFGFDSFLPRNSLKEWRVIEEKVTEKISRLPKALKKKVLNFIKPIRMEIVYWKKFHSENFGISVPNNLCWTPQGTVDKKKTAEILIRDEDLSIATRYKLACIYCLEKDIPELWNKIPEDRRDSLYWENNPRYLERFELVVFWTYKVKGELSNMNYIPHSTWRWSAYQYAFDSAVFRGNKAGTEYFLQTLTHREREESLVKYTKEAAVRRISDLKYFDFPHQHYTEVLSFLLSQLDEEQQTEVFGRRPCEVLICFLDWPWQSFFMETANRVMDYLTIWHCRDLLSFMISKVIRGYEDYDYRILFGKFWKQLPTTHKKQIISAYFSDPSWPLFLKLLDTKDKENIELIFKDATTLDGEDISSTRVKHICARLAYIGEWKYLEVFVQACFSTKDAMIKFKEDFKEYIRKSLSEEALKKQENKWNECFQLLDNLIHDYNISECVRKLLQIKDEENIKLILKDVTTLDREDIISSEKGKAICVSYVRLDEWNLLKVFVQECIPTKDAMIKFKEDFKEHIGISLSEETLEKEKDVWNECFQLLDALIHEYN